MFVLLTLVFIVMPLLELYVIIQVGQAIGALETIAVLIVISVVGAWLSKHEGLGVWNRMRRQLDAGKVPTNELIDGFLILVAGIMLMLPGFVTDLFGILFLLPPTRAVVRGVLKKRFAFVVTTAGGVNTVMRGRRTDRRPPDDVIDV